MLTHHLDLWKIKLFESKYMFQTIIQILRVSKAIKEQGGGVVMGVIITAVVLDNRTKTEGQQEISDSREVVVGE